MPAPIHRVPIALVAAIATGAMLALAVAPAAQATPGWLLPATDLSAPGHNGAGPRVGLDAAGDAVLLWLRFDGTKSQLEAVTRPSGGSWTPPTTLTQPGQEPRAPQLAVGPSDEAVAVWQVGDGADTFIESSSRPPGGGWSPATKLSGRGQISLQPQVAINAAGEAIAVWTSLQGARLVIEAASRPAGGSWSAAREISDPMRSAEEPAVAIDAAGEAVVAWTGSGGPTVQNAEAATRRPDGEWTPPRQISGPSRRVTGAAAAIDEGGNAVAVWVLDDGFSNRVETASRPAAGDWSPARGLSAPGRDASEPQIAATRDETIAVWSRSDGSDLIAEADSRPNGGEWSLPTEISEAGQSADEPQLTVDPAGEAFAVWSREGGERHTLIEAVTRPPGGAWSPPVKLSQPGENANQPAIAADAAGEALATWGRLNGENRIIQVAPFDRLAPALSGVSIPTAGTVGVPLSFSASALDNWSAVVNATWSLGDGSSATGLSAGHAYASPGTYEVSVTVADLLGNAVTESRSVAIAAAPATQVAPRQIRRSDATGSRIVRVRGGLALLRLSCPPVAALPCSGLARLAQKAHGKLATLGAHSFSIPAGATRPLEIRLRRTGPARQLPAALPHVTTATLLGEGVVRRSVVLKPQRRARRTHR